MEVVVAHFVVLPGHILGLKRGKENILSGKWVSALRFEPRT
jgi:hypothetical protein